MAKKQFKAESKRLLDLMVNSIYTHKEIFLRELVSNASDAIDKLYFRSLTDESVGLSREDFVIRITADEATRTLTISDNGCGMSAQELESNLGTIAKSGTLAFKQQNETPDMDIIGQFGVGFYSAFMVASNLLVVSRAFGSEEAYAWESSGESGYTLLPAQKAEVGTDIILTIKADTEDEQYSRFLRSYTLQSLVKKYSDYIRYPIRMLQERSRLKEGSEDEYETYTEDTVLNSMIPLWKRNRAELTDEDYNNFYKDKFFDFEDPLLNIHTSVEGVVSYNALLYIPAKAPHDYFSKDYQRGLQLYSSGVMIMEKCEELLPDYFGFVKGLVDSADLSLNISREMLQHDRQLRTIALNLKKRIKAELEKLLQNQREKYEVFYSAFALPIKYGLYSDYGANKEFLQDLVLFWSAEQDRLITLQEYVDAMPEGQQYIYYACGDNIDRVLKLPQTELVRDKGYDILCMTDDVDEFAVKMLGTFSEKPFMSVADNDLDIASEEEKQAVEEKLEQSKGLMERIKAALDEKVKLVRLTTRLKSSPVCLSSEGPVSIEMEKVLKSMSVQGEAKAERILELNPDHPVFAALQAIEDEDKLRAYAELLYNQALLIEGLPIEDPVAFSNSICELM